MTEFTPEWIEKARNACIFFGEPATTEFRKALDHIERLQARVEWLEHFLEEAAHAAACGKNPADYLATEVPTSLRDEIERQAKHIAELEQERRWIPVSESKPKSGVPVLVWNGGLHTAFWFEQQDDTPFGGHWVWHPVRKNIYTFMLGVTHWQPLPQPPQEEE